ncbi:hypothetical protein LCGC14_1103460, partial [marine sediment metagenome]
LSTGYPQVIHNDASPAEISAGALQKYLFAVLAFSVAENVRGCNIWRVQERLAEFSGMKTPRTSDLFGEKM